MIELEKRPCLFLDRDGVIIEDVGYPHKEEDLKILPGIVDLILAAKGKNFRVVVITNQAGLAKGIFKQEDYDAFTLALTKKLAEYGAKPDAIYYCPHHPDASVPALKADCNCRKPKPGLVLKASEELAIDLTKSLFIGDRDSDILAVPGLTTWLLKGRYPIEATVPIFHRLPDLKQEFEKNF